MKQRIGNYGTNALSCVQLTNAYCLLIEDTERVVALTVYQTSDTANEQKQNK